MQPVLLRPGAVPLFCQSRRAVQRLTQRRLDKPPWQFSHRSHCSVDIYTLSLQSQLSISLWKLWKWKSRSCDMLKFHLLCLLEVLLQGHISQETAAQRQQQYVSASLRSLLDNFFHFSISSHNQVSTETVTLLDIFFHISIRQKHRYHLKLVLSDDPFQYQLLLLKTLATLKGLTMLLFYVNILYNYLLILL